MNDDWRLQIDPGEQGLAGTLSDHLEARELEHDLSTAFHDRVIVSRNGEELFLYAGSREQVESARELVSKIAAEQGWSVEVELRRWHPLAERWEDPDLPMPESAEATRAEHDELIAAERKQAEETGHPEFEVRIDLPSRHDAVGFANQLRGEGLPVVRRWKFVLVGATDEDSAKALADRIRGEAPADSKVGVEGTWAAALAEQPPNPFAILGGLGA